MFIDVTEIRMSPGRTFHFDLEEQVPPLTIENDEVNIEKPLKISLDIRNTGKLLIFSGHITGDTELVCCRCLETYPFRFDYEFDEEFCHVSDLAAVAEEGQNTDEFHIFETNRIKLDDIITESILLGIPMKSICSENCQGLCATCGINLNNNKCQCEKNDIDPRMGVLKKFFEQ